MFWRQSGIIAWVVVVLVGLAILAGGWWAIHSKPVKPVVTIVSTTTPIAKLPTKTIAAVLNCGGDNTQKFSCYEKFYQQSVLTKDVKSVMSDLRTRYAADPYVKNECHQLAHVIGRAAGAKYPSVDEAYSRGDSACWSGYYHGVMESLMKQIGRDNLTTAVLDNICAPLKKRAPYSFDHYNCVHGLGHGMMYLNDNQLFVALKKCDDITDQWERTSCWSGAFMENVIADNKNHFTDYLKPDDPLYPCNAVNEQYKNTCYLMQTSYMLKVKSGDFVAVFKLCSQVGAAYEATCYQSLGRDASGWTISDPVRTKNYCLLGTTETQQSNCVIGAVKDFISYHHSDVQAKEFCNSLSDNLKNTCLSTGAAYYKSF